MSAPPPPSYDASVTVTPPVNQSSGNSRNNSKNNLLITGILHLISGGILVLLGIIAIPIRAVWSYFATSIWMGLLIIGLTGFLGVMAGKKRNRCLIHSYIGMSVVSSLAAVSLIFVYSFAAAYEYCYDPWGYGYCEYSCYPGGPSRYCVASQGVRKTINAFIVITASFEMILAIVSASFGCAYGCLGCASCCKQCCNCCTPPPPPQTTATFVNNRGGPAPITIQGVPQGGNIVVQGGPPNAGQPTYFIVQQAPINQYGAGPGPSGATVALPPQANPAYPPGQAGPSAGTVAAYPPPQINPGYVPEQTAAQIPTKL